MQKKRKRSRQGSGTPAKMPSSSHVYPLDPSSALVVTGEDDGPKSRLFKSHHEVWRDTLQWGEIRAIQRVHSGKQTSQEPSASPVLFGTQESSAPSETWPKQLQKI